MKEYTNKKLSKLIGKWKSIVPKEGESTPIQLRGYRLYNTTLKDFSLDDIRFMIGQNIGEKYLVEMAFESLKKDVLVDAMYYEGDVLSVILQLPRDFWIDNKSLYEGLSEILNNQENNLESLMPSIEVDRNLIKGIESFRNLSLN